MLRPALRALLFVGIMCGPLNTASFSAKASGSFTAASSSKLDGQLKSLVHKAAGQSFEQAIRHLSSPLHQIENEGLLLLVEGDPNSMKSLVGEAGGTIGSRAGTIFTVRLPFESLARFSASPAVRRVELARELVFHTDSSLVLSRADKVLKGDAPLPRSLSGKGVIIGILDSGIDYQHKEFRDPDDPDKSRILAIWDQSLAGGTAPQGFNYGSNFSRELIEQALASNTPGLVPHTDGEGHGTHVAGIAAGNSGYAPGADIILCRLNTLTTGAVDAVRYVADIARAEGRPFVINASFGLVMGPHDGSDLASRAIDAILAEKEGSAMCVAAGNAGLSAQHWGGFELEADSSYMYCFGQANPQFASDVGQFFTHIDWYLRIPEEQAASVYFAVACDSVRQRQGFTVTSSEQHSMTDWISVADIIEAADPIEITLNYRNGKAAGRIGITIDDVNAGVVGVLLRIDDYVGTTSPRFDVLDIWRILARGEGSFHAWMDTQTGIGVDEPAPGTVNDRYVLPDTRYSIATFPACGQNIIAVGAYSNRYSFRDASGSSQSLGNVSVTPGRWMPFSSSGPTADGRLKPEICAPGQNVIAAYSRHVSNNPSLIPTGNEFAAQSGTSMAAPAVAGTIALYLERFPKARYDKIYEAITATARRNEFSDEFGALPNERWGYGLLDAFAMLGSPTDIAPPSPPGPVTVYPNPASQTLSIKFRLTAPAEAILRIYSELGVEVRRVQPGLLPAGEHMQSFHLEGLASGTYFYQLWAGDEPQIGSFAILR